MTLVQYTAMVRADRLLELPEEALGLHLKPGQEVRIQVEQSDAAEVIAGADPFKPQNLAEFLGDFIGCIDGSGANNEKSIFV